MMEETCSHNSAEQMNGMVDIIDGWSLDIEQHIWKDEVILFCRNNSDIVSAMTGIKDDGQDLIIVMEDSTSDNVLDYNEFCFQMKEKYNEPDDFMVLDCNTAKGIECLYKKINTIYERG